MDNTSSHYLRLGVSSTETLYTQVRSMKGQVSTPCTLIIRSVSPFFPSSGHKFVDELDRVLGIADEAERSKKLKQFQEWDAHVHGVIQVGTVSDVIE